MKAFEIEQAAFDSACDYIEESVEYIQRYAENGLGVIVDERTAQKILDCRKEFVETGSGSNDHFYMIEKPLSEINI